LLNELKATKGQISVPKIEPVDFTRLFIDQNYLKDWLRYKYKTTLKKLKIDLNIFLLTNLIIFLLIGFINLKKEQSDKIKTLSTIAVFAILVGSFIYLFDQNWFYAIILNSYIGYSYSLIILVIFGVLTDITFNKGRIFKKLWVIP